jgi:hypothetical protein
MVSGVMAGWEFSGVGEATKFKARLEAGFVKNSAFRGFRAC